MKRTMVYLPENDAFALKRVAEQTGRSRADLIREGVAAVIAKYNKMPTARSIGIVSSGSDELANNAEDLLWDDDSWPS